MSSRERRTRSGYLVIADISGYTGFVVGSELEHAQQILAELTDLLVERLSAPFRFVELEGDAVFVFATREAVADAERLLDIIEACYAAFRLRLEQMAANTVCECRACRAIRGLDLKCVAHFGSFVLDDDRGKLVGSDVILVHRLLRNTVVERTGIEAYALLTEAFVERSCFGSSGLGLPEHEEAYPELGRVPCRLVDLAPTVARHREAARTYLTTADADLEVEVELPAPRTVVWAYHIDAALRLKWQRDARTIENRAGPGGRTEVGWESHCDHGSYRLVHRITDWRPLDYISMRTRSSGRSFSRPPDCVATFAMRDLAEGRCSVAMRLRAIRRGPLTRAALALFGRRVERQWIEHYRVLEELLVSSPGSAPEGREAIAPASTPAFPTPRDP